MATSPEDLELLSTVWASGLPPESQSGRRLHGELSGFPESAIRSFLSGESLDVREIPLETRVSPPYAFGRFRYSRDALEEQLAVGARWAALVEANDPELHAAYLAMRRRIATSEAVVVRDAA